jgi:Condensation domain
MIADVPNNVRSFPLYGPQRALAYGVIDDAEGQPHKSDAEAIWDLLLIRGEVSLPLLEEALRLSVEGADVFEGRLRALASGIGLVREPGSRPSIEVLTVPRGRRPNWRLLLRRFAAAVDDRFDLRRDALVRFVIAQTSREQTLLLVVGDHLALDAQSLGLLVRRAAEAYGRLLRGEPELARRAASSDSFFDHLEQTLALEAEWKASERYWSRRAATRRPMVQGASKPWSECCLNGGEVFTLTSAERIAMRAIARNWRISLGDLFSALVTLVVAADAEELPTTMQTRHGRSVPVAARVVGPLWEQIFTNPPSDSSLPLRRWIEAFAAEQRAIPPLMGRAVTDAWDDELVRNGTLVCASVRPFATRQAFGTAVGRSLDIPLPLQDQLVTGCALTFSLLTERAGSWRLLLAHDVELYPDPERLVRDLRRLLLACQRRPDQQMRQLVASRGSG